MSENKPYELHGYELKNFPFEVEVEEFEYFVPDEQLVDKKVMYIDRMYHNIETFVELDDALRFAQKIINVYKEDMDLMKLFDFKLNVTDVFEDRLVASTCITNINNTI